MEGAFRILDLVEMKLLVFRRGTRTRFSLKISPEMTDDAEFWRSHLLDQLSMFSDELTERRLPKSRSRRS